MTKNDDIDIAPTKHFLDTSIARQMIHGSKAYKDYFRELFKNDSLYISKYVQMEIRRGFLCNLINFYFTLRMPSIETIGDALSVWSDRFRKSELKAVVLLTGQLMDDKSLSRTDPKDKAKALRNLASYIMRVELKIRKGCKDIGINTSRCARALITLASHSTDHIQTFHEQFLNVKTCRSLCTIDDFILSRYRRESEKYIELGQKLSKPLATENIGFKNITKNLEEILSEGESACSCYMCEKIGDSVIALETPETMRIETIDYSFDHLCPPLRKSHFRHPPQTTIAKRII